MNKECVWAYYHKVFYSFIRCSSNSWFRIFFYHTIRVFGSIHVNTCNQRKEHFSMIGGLNRFWMTEFLKGCFDLSRHINENLKKRASNLEALPSKFWMWELFSKCLWNCCPFFMCFVLLLLTYNVLHESLPLCVYREMNSQASKVFLTSDLCENRFLCFLVESHQQLRSTIMHNESAITHTRYIM